VSQARTFSPAIRSVAVTVQMTAAFRAVSPFREPPAFFLVTTGPRIWRSPALLSLFRHPDKDNNAAGQLISASNPGGSGNGGGSESFAYAGATQDQPLSDGSATGIVYGLAGQDGQPWVQSYSIGGATDYVIRDQRGDSLGFTRSGATYMFATDNVGSVTGVVEYCGCTAATYSYTPYGALVSANTGPGTNIVKDNLIGYTGSLTDDMTAGSTGYMHDGNRWYDPATGTFASEDMNSYLASPSDGNRYAYAADNPATYIDPTGNSCGSNLLDYSTLGGSLVGTAESGVAIADLAEEASLAALFSPAALAVTGILGGVFALGFVGVALFSC
jgi:RHS repeat-associated protein